MVPPLLVQRAKNISNVAIGEMEHILSGRIYQGKRFNFKQHILILTFLNLKQSRSFKVECFFGTEGAQTAVHPSDWSVGGFTFPENESQRCIKANCYKKEIAYAPSKDQIKALVSLSTNCSQKVTHVCNMNGLSGLSSWIDAIGTANSYWHGNRTSGNSHFFNIRIQKESGNTAPR